MKKILVISVVFVAVVMADVTKCVSCHGVDFEKAALGKSKIVKDMNTSEIATALKGYKDGSYGGPMKSLMKGQVLNYSNDELEEIAAEIKPVVIVPVPVTYNLK